MATYIAKTGVENGRTGRRFEAGERVADDDFPPETIAHWLERGVLVVAPEPADPLGPVAPKPRRRRGKKVSDG